MGSFIDCSQVFVSFVYSIGVTLAFIGSVLASIGLLLFCRGGMFIGDICCKCVAIRFIYVSPYSLGFCANVDRMRTVQHQIRNQHADIFTGKYKIFWMASKGLPRYHNFHLRIKPIYKT